MSDTKLTTLADVMDLPPLRWHCQVCGKPIKGDSGYVELYAAVDVKETPE